jgi:hypothetical protein
MLLTTDCHLPGANPSRNDFGIGRGEHPASRH